MWVAKSLVEIIGIVDNEYFRSVEYALPTLELLLTSDITHKIISNAFTVQQCTKRIKYEITFLIDFDNLQSSLNVLFQTISKNIKKILFYFLKDDVK
jgi:hypothetical protein